MSSSRLPGKVLAPLGGGPSIVRQLERIRTCTAIDEVVVVTSDDPSDDLLVEVVEQAGFAAHRGPLLDVLSRFVYFLNDCSPDVLVRLTGDCPLTSPRWTDLTVRAFLDSDADYASNAIIATLPDGLDVEVMKPSVIATLDSTAVAREDREHVTRALHTGLVSARLLSVESTYDDGHLRWTLDTLQDYRFIRDVYARLGEATATFEVDDVLHVIQRDGMDCPRNPSSQRLLAGGLQLQRVRLNVG